MGVDLGGGMAWSAAVALWPSGRSEAFALALGVPDLAAQAKRDNVPRGTHRRLQAAQNPSRQKIPFRWSFVFATYGSVPGTCLDERGGRHDRPTCLNERRVRRVTYRSSAPDLDQQAAVIACAPLVDAVQGVCLHAFVEPS